MIPKSGSATIGEYNLTLLVKYNISRPDIVIAAIYKLDIQLNFQFSSCKIIEIRTLHKYQHKILSPWPLLNCNICWTYLKLIYPVFIAFKKSSSKKFLFYIFALFYLFTTRIWPSVAGSCTFIAWPGRVNLPHQGFSSTRYPLPSTLYPLPSNPSRLHLRQNFAQSTAKTQHTDRFSVLCIFLTTLFLFPHTVFVAVVLCVRILLLFVLDSAHCNLAGACQCHCLTWANTSWAELPLP